MLRKRSLACREQLTGRIRVRSSDYEFDAWLITGGAQRRKEEEWRKIGMRAGTDSGDRRGGRGPRSTVMLGYVDTGREKILFRGEKGVARKWYEWGGGLRREQIDGL